MAEMAALAAALALAAANSFVGSIEGHWMHPEQTVIIRLEPCGEAICGTVTWATERAQRDAWKGVDRLIGATADRLPSELERCLERKDLRPRLRPPSQG